MLVNLLFIMQKCKKIHKIGKILLDFTAPRVYYIFRNKNTEPVGRLNKKRKGDQYG